MKRRRPKPTKRRRFSLPDLEALAAQPADTDALPRSAAPRRGSADGGPDPDDERRRRRRRHVLLLGFGTLFFAGVLAALLGDHGYLDVRRARGEVGRLERERERLLGRVEGLRQQIGRLRDDPAALERIAREQLGLARPGEIVFVLPGEDEVPAAATEDRVAAGQDGAGAGPGDR